MLSVTIHGHFYQPPREDPFLGEVEAEESAAPFHDWNQRIERECYRAVVAARIAGPDGRIQRLVNTLEWISFNVGPTLLEWLEHEARATYDAILAADRASVSRGGGHGNAIAQPYHHTILPLASRRDKVTEVRWGIADFRRRFGRDPEGMWLPETAVDMESLEVLVAEGIRFTIVAPRQVSHLPAHGRPGICRLPGGGSIALCIYDGDRSQDVAFGGALHDGILWARRLLESGAELAAAPGAASSGRAWTPRSTALASVTLPTEGPDRLLSIATDGESYGHHHRFGEMALARALDELRTAGVRLENLASFLERNPASEEVHIVEPSSWSCAHGVGRWERDCGCHIDPTKHPSQAWRTPLRRGLNAAAAVLHDAYEREASALFGDPWTARNGYGAVVASEPVDLERYVRSMATGAHSDDDLIRARELLEMERDALRMFTSCGWFFDDIGGIEPRQDLRYAARAISLAGEEGREAETALLAELHLAWSNDPAVGTGADVYERSARPRFSAAMRHAAAAVGARHVSPTERRRFTSSTTEIDDDWVRVVDRRTGRRHDFRWHVAGRSATDLQLELVDSEGRAHVLTLGDLPERPRLAIRAVLRKALLPLCLSRDELDQLMSGAASMGGLLRVALIRAVEKLEVDEDPSAIALASDLIDLFEQFEARVPFDAQSAFWRVWQVATPARREALHLLHHRLGFATMDAVSEGAAG
jgi:hypothetical protein